MKLEDKYGAHNYHPLPVVLARGVDTKVFDVNGVFFFISLLPSSPPYVNLTT